MFAPGLQEATRHGFSATKLTSVLACERNTPAKACMRPPVRRQGELADVPAIEDYELVRWRPLRSDCMDRPVHVGWEPGNESSPLWSMALFVPDYCPKRGSFAWSVPP